MSASLTAILSQLSTAASVANTYESGGLQLQVKTNYTPALTVYNQVAPPSGLASLLGLQAGVQVLDASGNVVAQYGDWPPIDPVRVGLTLGALGLLAYGLVRLIRR